MAHATYIISLTLSGTFDGQFLVLDKDTTEANEIEVVE